MKSEEKKAQPESTVTLPFFFCSLAYCFILDNVTVTLATDTLVKITENYSRN